ncbi:restriction endonuclease subunit S [Faecalibacterium prausnitzii]|uniref:Restriction endonuclease subunit S n=1 Tax=Faecalibacterium prausnitzii TaxID=853 RepID=A0A3E2TSR9_9FIRM|nr:restriction endonuclease subunit S [Faecalibacterium prausnitzii]MDW2998912.1 restriction endonuclease subunit S [Faecalibacterium prausnitzii]RGB81399.1 restriction endonuclease subunit S [Faecalibacterium prausnitzii]
MAKLGDICTVVSGSTPKTGVAEYWDGTVKWITPAELNEDSFYITDSVRHITEDGKEKTGLSYLPKGTVILSSRAPIGKTAIAGCEMCCNQGFKNLICSDAVYNEYLYFFLKSKTNYLNSLGRGATFKEISKSIVEKIEIPLPNIEKQHQIVKELKATRNLIAHRKQQLTKLDELIKARFVEMFGDKNYHYESLINLILDGTSLSYGIVQPGNDGTGDMGVLRPVDIVDGKLTMSSIKYIDRSIGEGFKKTELDGDELLITVRGTTGITALTDGRFAGMNVTRGIAVIRYNRKKINPLYLSAYFNTDESQRYIQEHTRGATLQQINLSDLRIQRIMLPPLSLQNQFAAFVAEVDKSKVEVQKALDQTQLLFDSLMQQYFG